MFQFRSSILQQLNTLDKTQRDQLALLIEIRGISQQSLEKQQLLLKKFESFEQKLSVIHTSLTLKQSTDNPVSKSTQDWYTKATRAKDLNEKIYYYTEAINHN